MQQLKDALMKAGVIPKEKLLEIEKEKVRKRHKKRGKKDRPDQIQIICEACDKSAPDVERYDHDNRRLKGKEWLCIQCADEYQIDDQCRTTAQSSMSKQGRFIRRYGRTKKMKPMGEK